MHAFLQGHNSQRSYWIVCDTLWSKQGWSTTAAILSCYQSCSDQAVCVPVPLNDNEPLFTHPSSNGCANTSMASHYQGCWRKHCGATITGSNPEQEEAPEYVTTGRFFLMHAAQKKRTGLSYFRVSELLHAPDSEMYVHKRWKCWEDILWWSWRHYTGMYYRLFGLNLLFPLVVSISQRKEDS